MVNLPYILIYRPLENFCQLKRPLCESECFDFSKTKNTRDSLKWLQQAHLDLNPVDTASRTRTVQTIKPESTMDDEADTYKLWKIRKTIMQARMLTLSWSHMVSCFAGAFGLDRQSNCAFHQSTDCSCAMIEAIWSRRTNWIKRWRSSKSSSATSPAKGIRLAAIWSCWSLTTTIRRVGSTCERIFSQSQSPANRTPF